MTVKIRDRMVLEDFEEFDRVAGVIRGMGYDILPKVNRGIVVSNDGTYVSIFAVIRPQRGVRHGHDAFMLISRLGEHDPDTRNIAYTVSHVTGIEVIYEV